MIAVFVNCGAIFIGSIVGLLFAKKISKELSEIIQTAAGIVTCIIGIQSAFKYDSIVILTLSLIIGGLLGSWWDWDGKILALGSLIERMLKKSDKKETIKPEKELTNKKDRPDWNFAYAFLNSSVLFCVGAMAILGSLKAGIEKDYTIIFTKSILDGFMAITFASAMGPGTIFSCLSIFVYQGAITMLSGVLQPLISDLMLTEMTAVGGTLIIMIGINLLGLKHIKTANYLPAIILTIIFVIGKGFIA